MRTVAVNEGAKTGIFWAAALVLVAIATFVAWPPETESDTQSLIGQPLFPAFSDPLAASVLRIVSFDEEQGELRRFEVAKDETSGVWSLPSRNNYPADASEQMQNAANALVGVKILDIQTDNPEDHSSLGVLEPKVESLEVGDEGVGRLVTLKGDNNSTLAALIIGNKVKGSEEKRYVRIPQQDPVYVVALDDSPLSSQFEDWIEKDLLQLSSIDISNVEIQNYDAALQGGQSLSMKRSYDAKLSVDDANSWKLDSLVHYDEQDTPKTVTLAEGETLATAKLNTLKNALDDLKIVDVAAKPKGMSESLKADKDLVSDNDAVLSLATRGFFPVTQGDILSANGEMIVTLKDGVEYSLRFGNVEGLSTTQNADAEGDEPSTATGANRYLLVTARVNESTFPAPELRSIPKSIEELDAMEAEENTDTAEPSEAMPQEPTSTQTDPAPMPLEAASGEDPSFAEPSAEPPADPADPNADSTSEGPVPNGGAIEDGEASVETPSVEEQDGDNEGGNEDDAEPEQSAVSELEASQPAVSAEESDVVSELSGDGDAADKPMKADDDSSTVDATSGEGVAEDETEEEKQERLEAAQEKIAKENQRALDQRKDKLEAARRRVRELNSRFADWYYVIPEATYRQLRIERGELIEKPSDATADADAASQGPALNFPGFPE